MIDHADQVRSLLATYEKALNTGDAALAASCYTVDGLFMPTTLPTARGADMQAAYEAIFAAIGLDATFTVDELEITSDRTAYALTRSNGTQTIIDGGERTPESNREIFLLRREDAGWKISHYMFNKPSSADHAEVGSPAASGPPGVARSE